MSTPKKILIVDGDVLVLQALRDKILHHLDIEVLTASTYKESVKIIREEVDNIAVAIVDMKLPDAKDGSVLYLTSVNEIPSIIFTASQASVKESILQNHVIEYIFKDTMQTLEYTAKLAIRIIKNHTINILLVDDSKMSLNLLELTLQKMHCKIFKAEDGVQALKILNNKEHKFTLVITDYHMPNMDGLELTQEIRKLYKKDELAIIVASAEGDSKSTPLFLKVGANDFIQKPFSYEELALRINLNLELLDLFLENKILATKDTITPLFNSRFFSDSGESLLLKAQRDNKDILAIYLCIDQYDEVFQKYGMSTAERLLIDVAKELQNCVRRSDLLARQEGAEFSILFDNISEEDGADLMKKIHTNIANLEIVISTKEHINITLSIGAVYNNDANLPSLLEQAHKAMLFAKSTGEGKTNFFKI